MRFPSFPVNPWVSLFACAASMTATTGCAQSPAQMPPSAEAQRAPLVVQDERPPFREDMGALRWGTVPPDLSLQSLEGAPAKLHGYATGKANLVVVWPGDFGPGPEVLERLETLWRTYRSQGLQVIAIASGAARADVEKWAKDNRGKFSFPLLLDPSGVGPQPGKEYDKLTPEEEGDYNRKLARFIQTTVIGQLTQGGGFLPMPMFFVLDGEKKMQGWATAMGPRGKEAMGNLLLRAGVQMKAEDQPRRVFTRDETRSAPPEERVAMLRPGAMAPDFTTTDASGKPVKLSDYRGKTVVLDFWATWCTPCIASMPHTQEVARAYKDQGVVVLAVCTQDARAAFEAWVKTNQAKYPEMVFSHDAFERKPERFSRRLYGVAGIPTQFVIDPQGRIAEVVTGYRAGEVILEGALAKAGVKVDPQTVAKAVQDIRNREIASGGSTIGVK